MRPKGWNRAGKHRKKDSREIPWETAACSRGRGSGLARFGLSGRSHHDRAARNTRARLLRNEDRPQRYSRMDSNWRRQTSNLIWWPSDPFRPERNIGGPDQAGRLPRQLRSPTGIPLGSVLVPGRSRASSTHGRGSSVPCEIALARPAPRRDLARVARLAPALAAARARSLDPLLWPHCRWSPGLAPAATAADLPTHRRGGSRAPRAAPVAGPPAQRRRRNVGETRRRGRQR